MTNTQNIRFDSHRNIIAQNSSLQKPSTHNDCNQNILNQNNIVDTDIIIVGAGPIGLTMCKALQDSGLKIHLIEKQTQEQVANPQPDGREIAVTHHTKRLMQEYEQWHQLDASSINHLKRAEVFNGTSAFSLGFDKPDMVHGKPIETLGYLLSNNRIRQSAYDVLQRELAAPTYLTALFNKQIESVTTNDEYAEAKLASGETIRGALILAADSRVSFMRKSLGISADMHDFGRTVLLFRCKHTLSNRETAHEGFYYGKTLAVLPLGEYESSMVITIDNSKVNQIKSLSKQALADEMMTWLDGSLGDMTVVSDMYEYPLLGVHSAKFYSKRSALIGDAAVGLHPVTAHGYNLGMESVDILSTLIHKAVAQGRAKQDNIAQNQFDDLYGLQKMLRSYHRRHSLKTRTLYHGTNAIVKLYTDESTPAKVMRHIGLRLGDNFAPVKKLITAQLTG